MLAAATDPEENAFVAAVDELWRRGIVRADGPNAYDFSHGRIRDAAYADHRRVGNDSPGADEPNRTQRDASAAANFATQQIKAVHRIGRNRGRQAEIIRHDRETLQIR